MPSPFQQKTAHVDAPLSQTATDQELIYACRQGDAQAWSQLIERYQRLVYSIPLNYGLTTEDASDIAQIVFTSLLQGLDSLRDGSNLGGWLTTVTRRHTWRVVNRKKLRQEEDIDGEGIRELLPDRSSAIERWELVEWLNNGLNQVGERCRQLLMLLYFETDEPSYLEIAQRLGIAEGSIGPTRARCLQRMKEMMSGSR